MAVHLGEPRLDQLLNKQQNLSSSAALVLREALGRFPSARREEKEAQRCSGLIPWPPHLD